ncbi:uncharacterized protein LOC131313382 isoform X1 [Rhododendron vialii]|uniref:uncharacterized protein LOC131313382 isoform X1 n=1 Tax=Rhododendron vialii TaxID=182163 RepID=UPI00265F1C45|nr:uncharacterized protein LOC131313382 isoform X1 [Rhododendron vialii]
MRRWTAFQGEPKPTPNPATTEDPTNSSLRCGKWLLRSTKIRRSRGDKPSEGKPPGSQPLKRKRSSPSPTSSANSCTGENNVQLPTPMSSSTHPWHNEDEAVSSDDDELLDLEFLDLMEEEKIKMPQRTCELTGQVYTNFLLERHPQTIKDVLRVDAYTFRGLVAELVARGQLQWDHKRVCLEESLAIFLYICGHSQRHRVAADRFQRSTSTISDHFKWMRRALCNLAPHIIQPPNLDVTPPEILNDGRYYPWFQDCVGAIDGTHIEAWVPRHRQVAYRGRKSTITQNVMAACSFDMKFTFVLPGWEGSAHDGRVFQSAVTTPGYNFPHPPLNKYYLVDAGYTNMPGYLAPYRGRRYHRDEFNGHNTEFHTPMELFNYKHSSLRNVIERCFGVLKARFPILKHMPSYNEARQPGIVTACCVIHNWIIMNRGRDDFFDDFEDDGQWEGGENEEGNVANVGPVEPFNMSPHNTQLMAQRRTELAQWMWESYDD